MSTVNKRVQCPNCLDSHEDNLVVHDNGSIHCYACGYHTVTLDRLSDPPQRTYGPLIMSGKYIPLGGGVVSKETCRRFGVFQSTSNGEPILVFPYYKNGKVVRQKTKTVDKKFLWVGESSDIEFFGSQTMNSPTKRIIITEGEKDTLAVAELLGTTTHITSLTNGVKDCDKFAAKYYKKLLEYQEIVVCFDQDEAGIEAARQFTKNFPVGRVGIAKFSEKDAFDMMAAGKHEELKWAVIKPEIQRPNGVLRIGELSEEYFDEKFEKGIDIPFNKLNYHLGGLRKGELTMVTAGTGLGKSTWCTNLAYYLVKDKKLKIVDIKLEESQRKNIYTYLAMYSNKSPRLLRENPTLATHKLRRDFINTFDDLYVHNHFGSVDSNDLLNVLDYYATIEKVDFIFLDHISIAISGLESGREGERKDIDRLLTKIRELIDRTNVGFICVSHLSNPPHDSTRWEEGRQVRRSDLRGSGTLGQLADNIIAIEGDLINEDKKLNRTIKLIKTRYGDMQEVYCDTFTYDVTNGKISTKKEVL